MSLVLHGYWRSTAAYRLRIALNLKGVCYGQVAHDLRNGAQRDPAYLAIAPQGLVPSLETEDGVLTQSLAILEWLDEKWPQPAMLPADLRGRAIVRAMGALIGADIHPLNNLRVLQALRSDFRATPDQIDAWIVGWISDGFVALDRLIAQHGGAFAYGDQPGLADCLLVPQVYSAERFKVDLDSFPNVRRAASAAGALAPFAAAHPAIQPDADAP
ncbi:MAG: maleylacetoacetate isomerase [Phenylobacterium sp.]|uniref:maleylacetoacetate isomerase n=1 Tax=Phenylobacterium sp. TaxID=1871053 RepID=UPI002736A6E0|nr:maleylacetoacetate isomerase [Phenylobacterium sp.]MDP3749528.1 maleylacetoacetate isomerase [Phenylobacterium sp.]